MSTCNCYLHATHLPTQPITFTPGAAGLTGKTFALTFLGSSSRQAGWLGLLQYNRSDQEPGCFQPLALSHQVIPTWAPATFLPGRFNRLEAGRASG